MFACEEIAMGEQAAPGCGAGFGSGLHSIPQDLVTIVFRSVHVQFVVLNARNNLFSIILVTLQLWLLYLRSWIPPIVPPGISSPETSCALRQRYKQTLGGVRTFLYDQYL